MPRSAVSLRRSSAAPTRSTARSRHNAPDGCETLWRRSPRQLEQHRQSFGNRTFAHAPSPDFAEQPAALQAAPIAARGRKVDEADRLLLGAAARAGNAGNRHREIGRRMLERACGHGDRGLGAHRAIALERCARHAEHRLLGLVGIDDEAAFHDVGGAGDFGQRAGNRTAAVAMATMPSLRPVKPSFSLVVALTATRSAEMPAIAAMRSRMVSRCGETRGASQTMVTSRWPMMPPRAFTRSQAKAKKRSEEAPRHCGSLGGKC